MVWDLSLRIALYESAAVKFETLCAGYRFIEAPRIDARGSLYFSDLVAGGVHKRYTDGQTETFLPERRWIGGLVFNRNEGFVCSGLGGLVHFHERTGVMTPLLTQIDGEPIIAVNDIYADDEGGIYGGTVDFVSIEKRLTPAPGVLFRIDPTGRVSVLRRNVTVSNGIGLSPDRKLLYHSETGVGVWVYELDRNHSVRATRLFSSMTDSDGLAVDAIGGVWVAALESGRIVRFRHDGIISDEYELPVKEAVSLTFAGENMCDLYVAAGGDIYDPNQRRAAVYRASSPVAGQPNPMSRF